MRIGDIQTTTKDYREESFFISSHPENRIQGIARESIRILGFTIQKKEAEELVLLDPPSGCLSKDVKAKVRKCVLNEFFRQNNGLLEEERSQIRDHFLAQI